VHAVLPLPLAGHGVKGLDGIEDAVSVVASDEIEHLCQGHHSEPAPVLVHLAAPRPLVAGHIVDLGIVDPLFALLAAENQDLLVDCDGAELGPVGVEGTHFLPLEAVQVQLHY